MKVHYPKLYNMAHLLALNVLLLPKGLTIMFIRKIKHLINATTWWKPLDVRYPLHTSVSKGEGVRFIEKIFCQKTYIFHR